MNLYLRYRVWLINRLFWHEARMAMHSKYYARHLLRAAALLQKRRQLIKAEA